MNLKKISEGFASWQRHTAAEPYKAE